MVESYGVHPLADAGSLAFFVFVYLMLRHSSFEIARCWQVVASVAIGIGAALVIGTAVHRGDAGVAAYHLVLLAAAGASVWRALRGLSRPLVGFEDPVYAGRRISDRLVRAELGPDWDRLVGLDVAGNPVYDTVRR